MNTQHNLVSTNTQKFRDAESVWFWFVACKKNTASGRGIFYSSARPCAPIDIERLVTRLHLAGKISRAALEVLARFGSARRAPRQSVYSENAATAMWSNTMRLLAAEFRARGWIE